jgi:hypothetical protein
MTTDTTQFQREINEYSDELQQKQRTLQQQYPARYFDLMGESGQREATMVVVLDSQGRALQAILQYDPALPTFTQNKVQRQAQQLLGARFLGSGPTTPLYVMEIGDRVALVDVPHSGEDAQAGGDGSVNLLYLALGILGLFVALALLFWILNTIFRNPDGARNATATPPAVVTPVAAPPVAGAAPTADVTAPSVQTNGLPTSRLADPAIGVGTTVQMRQGLRSFVRSEAGAEAGEIVGYLEDGDTALVVGGPTWLQGDSDTIVWWFVELPNGVRGWTPANTSQFTLLDVAP